MEQIEVIVGKSVFHQKYLSVPFTEKWEQKNYIPVSNNFISIFDILKSGGAVN